MCECVCVKQTPKYTTAALFIEGRVTMWLADVPQAWSKFTAVSKLKVQKFNTRSHIRWLVGYAVSERQPKKKKEKNHTKHRLNKAKECAEAVVAAFFTRR